MQSLCLLLTSAPSCPLCCAAARLPAHPACWPACRMGDASLAAFLRKTFSERSQQLLSGSLKAPDGAALQRVISKLDEEEKTREQGPRGRGKPR